MKIAKLFTLLILLLTYDISSTEAQVKQGDTLSFWSVAYVDWYPANPPYPPAQYKINAICKKSGQHCYLFFDLLHNTSIPQKSIDSLVSVFDSFIYPQISDLYFPPPNGIDNDPKVYLLVAPGDNIWSGYFDPVQGMADSFTFKKWNKHSSQKEIIYLNTPDWKQTSAIAHELSHLVEWGHDHSPDPPSNPVTYWEEPWVSECFSTFGAYYIYNNMAQTDKIRYESTPSGDLSLIYFDEYEMRFLWADFMFEHYGGENFLRSWLGDTLNGIPSVRNSLKKPGYTQTFEETFEEFSIANYLDDKSFSGGKYGYFHFNFNTKPVLFRILQQHISLPLNMTSADIRPFSAQYIVFDSGIPSTIHFDGTDNSKFRLAFLMYNSVSKTTFDVKSIIPDSQNKVTFIPDSLNLAACDQLIMVVMNVDSSLGATATASYNYSAENKNSGIINTESPAIKLKGTSKN